MWVDEWAEAHAYIPSEGNAEAGKYKADRTPFAREVMRVLSPGHPCNRVVVMGASQLLKTQTAMNWMMASVDAAAANLLALMPSGDLAARLSARINNTIKATPRVRDLFSAPRSREGKNTDTTKTFRGGTLYIATAGSAANLAEIPARYGYGDEIDDWEDDLQGQGDPVEIFENRGSTYGRNRKWYYSSSPKKPAGVSKINDLYLRGDQRKYLVACPHCGHRHALVWANMRTDEALTWAKMMCPDCGALIEEHHKDAMLAGGQWVATAASRDGTISFTISQLYAPLGWTSWLELARLHDSAEEALRHGDHTKMQSFYNARLALCYDSSRGVTTAEELRARAEPYPPRVVPADALVLTATVDTQPDRLEVQIEAWGPQMEHWVLDHIVLPGSPTMPPEQPGSVWRRLDEIIATPLVHASGVLIRISAYGIDSGGANTQDVYNYGAQRRHLGCVILKGASRPNRPIIASKPSQQDVEWGGRVAVGSAELWFVGTDVAKDWLYNRMELTAGPGAMHFHNKLTDDWFEQLTVERKVRKMRGGVVVEVWHKDDHARNEATDLSVYNLAIAFKLRLHTWSALDWQRLRNKLVPAHLTPDLFASTAADQAAQTLPALPAGADPATEETTAPTQSAPPVATPAPLKVHALPRQITPYQPPRRPTARRIYSRGIQ